MWGKGKDALGLRGAKGGLTPLSNRRDQKRTEKIRKEKIRFTKYRV